MHKRRGDVARVVVRAVVVRVSVSVRERKEKRRGDVVGVIRVFTAPSTRSAARTEPSSTPTRSRRVCRRSSRVAPSPPPQTRRRRRSSRRAPPPTRDPPTAATAASNCVAQSAGANFRARTRHGHSGARDGGRRSRRIDERGAARGGAHGTHAPTPRSAARASRRDASVARRARVPGRTRARGRRFRRRRGRPKNHLDAADAARVPSGAVRLRTRRWRRRHRSGHARWTRPPPPPPPPEADAAPPAAAGDHGSKVVARVNVCSTVPPLLAAAAARDVAVGAVDVGVAAVRAVRGDARARADNQTCQRTRRRAEHDEAPPRAGVPRRRRAAPPPLPRAPKPRTAPRCPRTSILRARRSRLSRKARLRCDWGRTRDHADPAPRRRRCRRPRLRRSRRRDLRPRPRDIPRRPRRGTIRRPSLERDPRRTRASLATRRRRRRSPPPSRRGKAAVEGRGGADLARTAATRRSARVLRRSGTTETEIRRDSRDSTPIPSPFASPGRRRTRALESELITYAPARQEGEEPQGEEERAVARHRDARESIHHQSTRSNRGRVVPSRGVERSTAEGNTFARRIVLVGGGGGACLGLLLDRRRRRRR